MTKYSWSQIKTDFDRRKVPAPVKDADAFEKDFRARASLMRQDDPEENLWRFPALNRCYGVITVTALLIVGFWLWPASSTLMTQIKSLQVFVPHSGVIILADEEKLGTVVWVTDWDADDVNKG